MTELINRNSEYQYQVQQLKEQENQQMIKITEQQNELLQLQNQCKPSDSQLILTLKIQ